MTAPLVANARVTLDVEGRRAFSEVRRAARDAGREAGRDFEQRVGPAFQRAGREAGRDFSDGFRQALNFRAASAAIDAALGPARLLASATAVVSLTGAVASLAGEFGQLAAAAAPAVGIVAAVPALAVVAGAAVGTLAVALGGVGDAFEAALSGDAEDFAEALERLSPAARQVAIEFSGIVPLLRETQSAVQDAFFGPLVGQLQQIADVIAGPLTTGMVNVATALAGAALQIAAFVRDAETLQFLQAVFRTTADVVNILSGALRPLLSGIRDLAGVGLPFAEQFAGLIAQLAARFGEFLSAAVDSGEALGWIENAVNVIGELVNLGADFVAILFSIGEAAASVSQGDSFGALGALLTSIRGFVESEAGQRALQAIFETLGSLGSQVGDVIAALATNLGRIAPFIADIAEAFGPALVTVINAFGDALVVLGPALGPLAEALASIVVAATPLLPLIGQIAALFAQNLTTAARALVLALSPVISQLAESLAPLIPQLAAAMRVIAPIILQVAAVFGRELATALTKILPALVEMAPVLIRELIPAFKDLALALVALLPALVPIAIQLSEVLIPLLPVLLPLILQVAVVFTQLLLLFVQINGPLLILLLQLAELVVNNTQLLPLLAALTLALGLVSAAIQFWSDRLAELTAFLSGLDETISSIFTKIRDTVVGIVTDLGESMGRIVFSALQNVRDMFGDLPQQIVNALSGLGNALANALGDGFRAMRETVLNGVQNVIDLFVALRDIVSGLLNQVAFAAFNSGRAIVENIIDGIYSRIDALRNAASDIAETVRDFLPFSPAKTGPLSGSHAPERSGQAIARNLAAGLLSGLPALAGAANSAAATISAPLQSTTNINRSRTVAPIININNARTNNAVADAVMRRLILVGG